MELSALTAISPIDGRYRGKTSGLDDFFLNSPSYAIASKWKSNNFIALAQLPLPQLTGIAISENGTSITDKQEIYCRLRSIYENFTTGDAQRIKDHEAVTNHDVKAVEYFLKEQFDSLGLSQWKEFIHFGLTSQDINNTAVPMSLRDALDKSYLPPA